MKTIVHTGVSAIVLTTLALSWTPAARADSPQKTKSQSLQHWREARFGMFIHWGPVSLTEKEISWSRANSNPKCPNNGSTPVAVYDNLYKEFNPTKFNAKQWVAIAKAAGMKYMVLTAKHCDGFLLWDSKVDDYNIMHTPFHRDVLRRTRQSRPRSGNANRLVFLADGLARSGFPHRPQRGVRGADAGRNPRASDQLRQDRLAVVRLGRAQSRCTTRRPRIRS